MDIEAKKEHIQRAITRNISFDDIAFQLFAFQYTYNSLYRSFCQHLDRKPSKISTLTEIPFLPVQFFKTHKVMSGNFVPEVMFLSSGTAAQSRSKHYVKDKEWYRRNAIEIFESSYGPLDQYIILALLPSYLEQGDSSLVFMVNEFMKKSGHTDNRFYRYDFERLKEDLERLKTSSRKVILWGVSFALVDFAEKFPLDLNSCIVMETGGMKGRRREWIRSELHDFLKDRLNVNEVHSEYGMAEMLSQFYAPADGVFRMGERVRIIPFDISDPLSPVGPYTNGRCHIIDLANIDSCCFVATEDLCRLGPDNTFEITGRLDFSEIRGCNLMYQ